MKFHELFGVLSTNLLGEWREEIEKSDACGFLRRQREEKEKLKAHLDEENKKLADYFEIAVENSMDEIYFELCKALFVYALKTGMDMQRTIDMAEE